MVTYKGTSIIRLSVNIKGSQSSVQRADKDAFIFSKSLVEGELLADQSILLLILIQCCTCVTGQLTISSVLFVLVLIEVDKERTRFKMVRRRIIRACVVSEDKDCFCSSSCAILDFAVKYWSKVDSVFSDDGSFLICLSNFVFK